MRNRGEYPIEVVMLIEKLIRGKHNGDEEVKWFCTEALHHWDIDRRQNKLTQ